MAAAASSCGTASAEAVIGNEGRDDGMQALNVAAILLTGSACSVLLLQARHRLLICRIPALVIFLLLDLPLYGILLYLHADTAEALLRRAVLGGGFAIGCIVIALLFLRRKKVLLSYGCLLYTSPSPRDGATSRMPSSA